MAAPGLNESCIKKEQMVVSTRDWSDRVATSLEHNCSMRYHDFTGKLQIPFIASLDWQSETEAALSRWGLPNQPRERKAKKLFDDFN